MKKIIILLIAILTSVLVLKVEKAKASEIELYSYDEVYKKFNFKSTRLIYDGGAPNAFVGYYYNYLINANVGDVENLYFTFDSDMYRNKTTNYISNCTADPEPFYLNLLTEDGYRIILKYANYSNQDYTNVNTYFTQAIYKDNIEVQTLQENIYEQVGFIGTSNYKVFKINLKEVLPNSLNKKILSVKMDVYQNLFNDSLDILDGNDDSMYQSTDPEEIEEYMDYDSMIYFDKNDFIFKQLAYDSAMLEDDTVYFNFRNVDDSILLTKVNINGNNYSLEETTEPTKMEVLNFSYNTNDYEQFQIVNFSYKVDDGTTESLTREYIAYYASNEGPTFAYCTNKTYSFSYAQFVVNYYEKGMLWWKKTSSIISAVLIDSVYGRVDNLRSLKINYNISKKEVVEEYVVDDSYKYPDKTEGLNGVWRKLKQDGSDNMIRIPGTSVLGSKYTKLKMDYSGYYKNIKVKDVNFIEMCFENEAGEISNGSFFENAMNVQKIDGVNYVCDSQGNVLTDYAVGDDMIPYNIESGEKVEINQDGTYDQTRDEVIKCLASDIAKETRKNTFSFFKNVSSGINTVWNGAKTTMKIAYVAVIVLISATAIFVGVKIKRFIFNN